MAGNKLQGTLDAFRELIQQKGWIIVEEKPIQSGYQITVTDAITKVPVSIFQSGKMLIQGKPGVLQDTIKQWSLQKQTAETQTQLAQPTLLTTDSLPSTPISRPQESRITGVARIGSDESGKGDYFGPLVVAAVYVNAQTEQQLAYLKVRDSKTLPDNIILSLAEEIKQICRGQGTVRRYLPERYNELYTQLGNLNLLLADAHAQAIANLAKTVASEHAIVDKFADESLVQQALLKLGCKIAVEQRPRAEDDIAVAAASIIARATFVNTMQELSDRFGIYLPKGAADPNIITTGREFVARYGRDALGKVAKLHFKTTQAILQE